DVGFRVLTKGRTAPTWRFENDEGVQLALEDYLNEKLLLHIGWADNVGEAMADFAYLRKTAGQQPQIVHLITAVNHNQFTEKIKGRKGVFLYVPPPAMEQLKEQYHLQNRSNHYFLIGEDGKIIANHYDLGTAKKLSGAWEKIAVAPSKSDWTPEQRATFWQSVGIGTSVLLLISGIVFWRRRLQAQREQRRRQFLELELRGIRSQMNPHFLFNAMSAIQNLIRKKEADKADIYLGEFAGLMRKTLRNSAEAYIPLRDEVEALDQYCKLESLRQPFAYSFKIDEGIDAYNTYIPSMLLQPILENAILHGLGPTAGDRELRVHISLGKEGLACTITDNGIGILAAQARNSRENHQSMGMKLVRQRLELMGLGQPTHLMITDRSTLDPPAQGTLVSITIPLES
ncbi:MAG: histidine kinase, partial [Bacteroidota bacterium]